MPVRVGRRYRLLRFLELQLQLIEAALQIVFSTVAVLQLATERGLSLFARLELGSQQPLGLTADLLTSSCIGFLLLQFCNAVAEEVVDDFEFADACLEARVGCDKLLVGLRRI